MYISDIQWRHFSRLWGSHPPARRLPFPPLLSYLSPFRPFLHLEVGLLKSSYKVCGSAVSSPSGVWVEIEFGEFQTKM